MNVIGTGNIELFKYNNTKYSREIIEDKLNMHGSAITLGDINNDGKNEIIASTLFENKLLELLQIQQYKTLKLHTKRKGKNLLLNRLYL